MAQRLATEYVKTCLELTEAEMQQFITWFTENQAQLQVMVLENGSQDFLLHTDSNEEIRLAFERRSGKVLCTGSCRLNSPKLTNIMRKAVAEFKGNAIVNRVYKGFTMVYYYERGAVVKIVELKDNVHKVIYEFKDRVAELELLFARRAIEMEIQVVQQQIDRMLDLRNVSKDHDIHLFVDECLSDLSHRLFVLEG